MMRRMIRNRSIRYEVQVRRDGRWVIDSMREEAEDQVIIYARRLLKIDSTEEIKVVRYRAMPMGFETQSEILRERRTEPKDKPMVLTGDPACAPACKTSADLYGMESRLAISRLFRQFQDKYQISATELLHGYPYQRKLQDTGTLLAAAIYKIAAVQANSLGMTQAERVKELEMLVAEVSRTVRAGSAKQRQMPALDGSNLQFAATRIKEHFDPQEAPRILLCLLTERLMVFRSLDAKLEFLLSLRTPELEPETDALLESLVADVLNAPEVMRALLGQQQGLGAVLSLVADIAQGREVSPQRLGNASLATLAQMIRNGEGTACRMVLTERLCLGLESEQDLEPSNPEGDDKAVEALIAKLRDGQGGFLGSERARKALATRKVKNRQKVLRRMGMHDAADILPDQWKPVIE